MPNVMESIKRPPSRLRGPIVRGYLAAGAIVRDGGDKGSGLLPGIAVISKGEALGHGFWIDDVFLDQVASALAAEETGVKSRFTHPSLSGDGLGKYLGRTKGGTRDGDLVRGDLHISKLSMKAPDGNLGGYVMDFAEEDPEAFGCSIVFDHDFEAEESFLEENGGTYDPESWCWAGFQSPDPLNVKNLPHARLALLAGVDIVDEPAANPSGLFYRGQEVPQEADLLLGYALGLSDEKPDSSFFGVDPDRFAGYLQRYLARHNLSLSETKGANMPIKNPLNKNGKLATGAAEDPEKKPTTEASEDNPEGEMKPEESTTEEGDPIEEEAPPEKKPEGDDPVPENEDEKSQMGKAKRFQTAFGRELGSVYFADGLSFEQASDAFRKEQAKETKALKEENEKLRKKLSAASGEGKPVGFEDGEGKPTNSKLTQALGSSKLAAFAANLKLPTK